jgi:hypothetical protein
MTFQGHREYRKREFCNDIRCIVQMELNNLEAGSETYERIRKQCKEACMHTTHEFHYWLMEKGFLIVKKEGNS